MIPVSICDNSGGHLQKGHVGFVELFLSRQ